MRDTNEVVKKMARNGLKIAKSLGCAFHFEFILIFNKENPQNFKSPNGLRRELDYIALVKPEQIQKMTIVLV